MILIKIPETELKFSFSRSGGAGGQNINKVETKVTVRWNFNNSPLLNDNQKNLIATRLKNRINDNGELMITSQKERTQAQNRRKAVEVLNKLVNSALIVHPKRKPTKIPRSIKEGRLRKKKGHSRKKELRKKIEV